MKTVKYHCDLCREEKKKEDLKTLFFKSDITPQRYVLLDNQTEKSDKHICIDCVKLIKDF